MHKQRRNILIAAIAGCIAVFLPFLGLGVFIAIDSNRGSIGAGISAFDCDLGVFFLILFGTVGLMALYQSGVNTLNRTQTTTTVLLAVVILMICLFWILADIIFYCIARDISEDLVATIFGARVSAGLEGGLGLGFWGIFLASIYILYHAIAKKTDKVDYGAFAGQQPSSSSVNGQNARIDDNPFKAPTANPVNVPPVYKESSASPFGSPSKPVAKPEGNKVNDPFAASGKPGGTANGGQAGPFGADKQAPYAHQSQSPFTWFPGITPVEMNYLEKCIAGFSDDQKKFFFVVYSGKRKNQQDILLYTALGFFGVAGIQRFVLGDTGIGVLYLLTCGCCFIGTIVDLVNYQSMTADYNMKMAQESFRIATMSR